MFIVLNYSPSFTISKRQERLNTVYKNSCQIHTADQVDDVFDCIKKAVVVMKIENIFSCKLLQYRLRLFPC